MRPSPWFVFVSAELLLGVLCFGLALDFELAHPSLGTLPLTFAKCFASVQPIAVIAILCAAWWPSKEVCR